MADEIAPALTPEWSEKPWWADNPCSWGICNDDPEVLAVQVAVANHRLPADHPLKITRGDAHDAHECAANLRAFATVRAGPFIRDGLLAYADATERLAAKLDALLAPEGV